MSFEIKQFDFKGIKRITIPKTDEDFKTDDLGWSVIKKFLPAILNTHKQNADKIKYLYNYFLGEQDILAKKRKHDVDKENNNKEIENHANRQVEFKVGFLCGEHRDYTHKSDSDSDDLTVLDRYFTDCNFYSKDAELKEYIYSTGIGVTRTTPRTDIIITEDYDKLTGRPTTRYATKEEGFDIQYEAPFVFDCVDPTENFVVYSSSTSKEPLFNVSYVEVDLTPDNSKRTLLGKQLLIETRYAIFEFKASKGFTVFYWDDSEVITTRKPKHLNYLPLIEFSINKDRMGLVEKNRSSYNTINLFRSSTNDMVVDNANAILVFKNVDIESEEVKKMREAGAIIISDNQNARVGGSAELDTVTVEIPFDKMATYIEQVMTTCYDIAGVPLASGQVTSGGDTGQARLLGGGWNNAYIIIHKEIQALLSQDYEQLKLFLKLCKQVPMCPLDELYASQIDINYRVNQNDNFLVKAQGMYNLFQMNLPYEFILKAGGLSNDIKTDAKEWKKYAEEKRKQEQEAQQTKSTNNTQVDNNDNNSKE